MLLVFKKYVASLGWVVALSTSNLAPDGLPVCATISKEAPEAGLDQPRGQLQVNLAVLCFLEGACGLLEARIRCAQRDMVVACKSSLAHGALITLRCAAPHLKTSICRELLGPENAHGEV